MLKRKGSRLPFFAIHRPSRSLTSPPTPKPKPGRTLVLSSQSSIMDFNDSGVPPRSHMSESYADEPFFHHEPLFDDVYLHPQLFDAPPPLLNVEDEHMWMAAPLQSPSIKWSMDIEQHDFSSDEEDDIIDSYGSTSPEFGFLATQIVIVYSGKAKMIDIFPQRNSSLKQALVQPSHNISRRSSSSTRDYSVSSFGQWSASDDGRSSPASSISEFSNGVYETIPEEFPLESKPYPDQEPKPVKRGTHVRNPSSISFSRSSMEKPVKQADTSFLELDSPSASNNSSNTKLNHTIPRRKVPSRISSFSSDTSSIATEESLDKFELKKSRWGFYLPETSCS